MSQDAAVRRRNEGKDAVARREVWRLEVAGFRVRCLADGDEYLLQARVAGEWKEEVFRGRDPQTLLVAFVHSQALGLVITERARAVDR